MPESEIQKLISIFLSLAIIVSSAIFVFSDNLVNSYKSNYEGSLNNSYQNNSGNSDIKNAFVESVKDLPPSYSTISLNDEFQLTGNLTDDLASYAAREIVKANPNGPQIDEGGNQNITIPDIENLTSNFAATALPKINLPDWDKEVEKNYSKINIIDNSQESVSNYLTNFNKIYEKYLARINIESLLNNSSDYRISLESISQINNDFYQEFLNLKVPNNFLEFHKGLLKILTYQQELLRNGEKINNDPLYVYYLIESNDSKITNALKDFEKEIKKIKNLGYIYQNDLSKNNILEKIFLIKKTYALFGFLNIVFDPAAVAELVKKNLGDIKSWLKKLTTEILKDQLIHKLVYQVVRWVQGGGKPQFVTNWKQFLTDAANKGIGEALYQIYPRVCQPFRVPIQIAFQSQSNIYDNQVACTLGDVVNNLKEFYNDFKYGGWIAYGQVLNPKNNLWGSLIIANDIIIKKGLEKKESEKSEAQANKGFLSTKRCVKEKEITVPKEIGITMPQIPDTTIRCGPINESGLAITADTCLVITCEQYENTTPGALIADITGSTISMGPIGRIVNAQDVAALVSALFNSALNKLILAGQRGLAGLFNRESDYITNLDQNMVKDINDPCFGEIIGSESYNNCRKITGGGGLYDADTNQQQIELANTAKSILKKLQDNIDANNRLLNIAPTTQSELEEIGGCTSGAPLCPNLSNEACALNSKIEELKIKATTELEILPEEIQNVQTIISDLNYFGKLTPQRLGEITQELSRYNDLSINAPVERLSKLEKLQSAVEQNISESPQCQTPLPQL